LEDSVKLDKSDDWAYDEVDDVPIYSPEDLESEEASWLRMVEQGQKIARGCLYND
jgi:hypothetical protein